MKRRASVSREERVSRGPLAEVEGTDPHFPPGSAPRGPSRRLIYDAPLGLELKSREVTWFV